MLHGIACAAAFAGVGLVTAALAAWTTVGSPGLITVVTVGIAACGGYAYFLLRRYRVRCPECEFEAAHFARDMQNRLLLICPQCGYRASTGRKVLADSPVGH